MYPRTNYEMTEADLEALLRAMEPVPLIMLNLGTPRSQQESANDAWSELGKRMGFDHMTVRPINGKGSRFFTAVPNETPTQLAERTGREVEEARQAEIVTVTRDIATLQERLATLGDK